MPIGDQCWKVWGEGLRKKMMIDKLPEITKRVENIRQESGTDEELETLQSPSFWNSVGNKSESARTLDKAGIDVDFNVTSDGRIEEVCFKLQKHWLAEMNRPK